jgi:hypothetical protein
MIGYEHGCVSERTLSKNVFAEFLSALLRTVEIENEALREMLRENGVPDEALQAALNQKTSDPELQKRVDSTIAPAVKEMARLLEQVDLREALLRWRPKGRPN